MSDEAPTPGPAADTPAHPADDRASGPSAVRRPGNLAEARLIAIDGVEPTIDPQAFVAPGVTLIGDVRLHAGSSVYYGCVLRADGGSITIGEGSNVQDNTVMHADPGKPVTVGKRVSIGHQALVHGCTVEDDVLVGMSATVLNRAVVGRDSLVAAGAVVLEDTVIPAGSLVAGVPAKVRRELTDADLERVHNNAKNYDKITQLHRTLGQIVD